jgi:hypothetical protein
MLSRAMGHLLGKTINDAAVADVLMHLAKCLTFETDLG